MSELLTSEIKDCLENGAGTCRNVVLIDNLRTEIARLKEDNEKWRQLLKTQTSIFRDLTDKIEKLKEDAEMKLE